MPQPARHVDVTAPTVRGQSDSIIPTSFFDSMARLLQKMGDECRPDCRNCPAMERRLACQHRRRTTPDAQQSGPTKRTTRKKLQKGSLCQP